MINETSLRGSNCILRIKFSMSSPPNYLKGKDKLAYMEERAWVANDFIDYAGRQGKYSDKATSFDEQFAMLPPKGTYLDYVSRRGSFAEKGEKGSGNIGTGVWNKNGPLEGVELERVAKVFKTTKGNIWHGIISPTKELGDKLLNSKEKAMEFCTSCFTRFLSSTHLNYDNIEWYAGWHDDSKSGIKHIQFAFCEKGEHLNKNGQKSYTQRGKIKSSVLADALLNFEEYFSGHKNEVFNARDNMMSKMKDLSLKDIKKDVALELLHLSKTLPQVSGRAGYRSKEYEPYRKQIDTLSYKLIRSIPELNKGYINLMSTVDERESRFCNTAMAFVKMQPTDKIAKLRQDIKERIGNSIINISKRMQFGNDMSNQFNELRQARIGMVAKLQEEKKIRTAQQQQRRKDIKRIKRMFNCWWQETSAPNYLEQYYADLERLKGNDGNQQDNNKE